MDCLLDSSMLSIAAGDFVSALANLQRADAAVVAGPNAEPNVVVINNVSVCMLYLGRLKEAISFLESRYRRTRLLNRPGNFAGRSGEFCVYELIAST